MARRLKMHSYYLDDELAEGLKTLKVERGVPESEQVRRAVRMWLEAEGVLVPQKPLIRRQKDPIDRCRS